MKQLLYEGKAKKVFTTDTKDVFFIEFKNSLTAFNALKKGEFEDKGVINRDIAGLIFAYLQNKGIHSHWLENVDNNAMLVRSVKIIPLEVVVRNILAGSTAKKLGIPEGRKLKKPLVEFYYKDDALGDPFLSDDQIELLEIASTSEVEQLKIQALKINQLLVDLFAEIEIDLVDFKIEFGKTSSNEILLADEITPDCCRLWDKKSQEKLDKDRFRRDLGNIKESYVEVLNRLSRRLKK